MFADVEKKIKKKNQILFSRESESLNGLRALICEQTHLTLCLWAFDCLQIPMLALASKYPEETDIPSAYAFSLAWAHGELKMPLAQRGILDCHAVAKRLDNAYDIALCHAIGQGCSTVHVETHALGLVLYELTAIVIQCGYVDYENSVLEKIDFYTQKLLWWQAHGSAYAANEKWAEFLTRANQVNKEKQLYPTLEPPCASAPPHPIDPTQAGEYAQSHE